MEATVNGILGQWWRIGGACGIIFIVLFLVGGVGIQGEVPMYDASVDEIRAYWEEDGETYLIGDYLLGLAFLFLFVPFASALRGVLARAEGSAQFFSRAGFAGAVIAVVLGGTAGIFWGAMAFGAENLSDDALTTLMYIDVYAFSSLGLGLALFAAASSLAILQTGALWRWLGLFGLLVALGLVISPLAILANNPEDSVLGIIGFIVGYIGILLFILIASIGMIMKKEEPVMVSSATRTALPESGAP